MPGFATPPRTAAAHGQEEHTDVRHQRIRLPVALERATGPPRYRPPPARRSRGRRLRGAHGAGVGCQGPTTWLLETVWVMAGLPLTILLRRRFPLSGLLCGLLAAHALVLTVGGHYNLRGGPGG